MKRTITLEIAGTRFRLVSDADQQHLETLAEMINARVEKFGRSGVRTSNSASSSQLLALAALDLADELKSSEAKLAEVERLTRAAIANAISRIDRGLSHEGKGGESV